MGILTRAYHDGVPTESESLIAGRVSYRYQRHGHGPAMVLVHGLLGYSFSWRRVVDDFSLQREVFALDMPGCGFSESQDALDPHLSAAADRLLAFLDAQGIASCDLVGSSYGGTTALFLASKHPHRIRSLTLVSPANPWSRIGRKRLALLRLPFVQNVFPPVARKLRIFHRISVRRMYGDASRVTSETLHGYSLPLMRKGVFEHALRIASHWHYDMRELEAALPAVAEVPTLIVWGSKDRLVELSSAEILARHLKQCRLVVLEGAGHLPYEECPEAFTAAVSQFLAEHAPSPVLGGK